MKNQSAYHDRAERRSINVTMTGSGTVKLAREYSLHIVNVNFESPLDLQGFSGQYDGRYVYVKVKPGTVSLVILHENGSATAQHRIICPGGADYTIIPGDVVCLVYDGSVERWLLLDAGLESRRVNVKFSDAAQSQLNSTNMWLDVESNLRCSSSGQGYVMLRPGSITGFSAQYDVINNAEGVPLKFRVLKNGSTQLIAKSLSGTVGQRKQDLIVQSRGVGTFVAGDTLQFNITCVIEETPPQLDDIVCLVEMSLDE